MRAKPCSRDYWLRQANSFIFGYGRCSKFLLKVSMWSITAGSKEDCSYLETIVAESTSLPHELWTAGWRYLISMGYWINLYWFRRAANLFNWTTYSHISLVDFTEIKNINNKHPFWYGFYLTKANISFNHLLWSGYTYIIIKNTKIWTIINDSGGFVIKSNSVGSCQVKPTLQLFCSPLSKSTNNALHF